jgi:DNA-binding Xre family transcriptional regulator
MVFMKLRIKELAAERGVKLQAVAKAIGIKHNTLSSIIKTGRTTTERIEALCAYFDISIDELVVLDGEYLNLQPITKGENPKAPAKGHLTKNVSLDVKTIFDSIAILPPKKQKPLIEAMQKMVEAAFS